MKKAAVWILLLLLTTYLGLGIVRSLYLESTPIALQLRSTQAGVTGTVRIVQLSDLHNATFGRDNQALADLVASKRPDVIVTTGDMIDRRARLAKRESIVGLYERLMKIAPVVCSLGNHELYHRRELPALLQALEEVGVHCVHDTAVMVHVNGLALRVGGLYFPEAYPDLARDSPVDILLCHMPDKFAMLAEYGVPLVFAGHTHGGQFRVPVFDIATYAPGQGFFPAYTKGLYTLPAGISGEIPFWRDISEFAPHAESHMIVSRGLGNSSFPFRVHNPPEIIVADITYTNQI